MHLPSRIVRIVPAPTGGLLAADVSGRIHLLDDDLRLVRSSSPVSDPHPLYALAVADGWVVTKDKMGGISRWALDTLALVDHLAAAELAEPSALVEGEEPSPTINRGLAVHDGRVYVNNGYLQLVVIDLERFTVLDIRESPSPDYLECICLDRDDLHAVTDKKGRLFLGDITANRFPVQVRVDDRSNLHRVHWDPRHDRFWVTQDSGDGELGRISNGIITVDEQGHKTGSLMFATDDVEFVHFTSDFGHAWTGGFEGELHLLDNSEPELRIERTVARFEHNIIDFAIMPRDDRPAVLTQDGGLVVLDEQGHVAARAAFRRQCAWDLQPDPREPDRILVATDDGAAELRVERDGARADQVHVRQVASYPHDHGITRRLVPLDDGGWIGVTRWDVVLRCSADGGEVWSNALGSRLFTVAVSPDGTRVLVAANEGGIELSIEDGTPVDKIVLGNVPVWACAYADDGDRLLAGRDGVVHRIDGDGTVRWSTETGDGAYAKRLWFAGGRLWCVGGGGLHELDPDTGRYLRGFSEFLENTVEDGVVVDGFVYACSYGQQLGVYVDPPPGEEIEALGLLEPMPDFAKSLHAVRAADGTPNLLLGGRGGWIRTYRLVDGEPIRVRDLHLAAQDLGDR